MEQLGVDVKQKVEGINVFVRLRPTGKEDFSQVLTVYHTVYAREIREVNLIPANAESATALHADREDANAVISRGIFRRSGGRGQSRRNVCICF